MAPYYGWNGKLLKIDLSEGRVEKQSVDFFSLKSFLGGRGLNIWTLFRNLTESINPFDPENVLAFGAGPMVGTLIPANGRYNVSSRSPLTLLLGDAIPQGSGPRP
jgi:aldehyde:ferredoxin oxidoreductase